MNLNEFRELQNRTDWKTLGPLPDFHTVVWIRDSDWTGDVFAKAYRKKCGNKRGWKWVYDNGTDTDMHPSHWCDVQDREGKLE